MMKNKLMILLILVVLILCAVGYYVLTSSDPKNISFYEPKTQTSPQSTQTSKAQPQQLPPQQNTMPAQNPPQNKALEQSTPANTQRASKPNLAPTMQSLRSEYEALLKRSRHDRSLGEPRYDVYIVDSQKLHANERKTINSITTTLSRRGGFLEYALFVEKINTENIKITLFNKSLLDETNFIASPKPLPPLWFKFNQSSMQSIKNSFYINELKATLKPQSKIKSIVLSGHTDEVGNAAYNYMLGLKRSAAVASEFLRISGKIIIQSFGKDKQLTHDMDESKRYVNRRVETLFE
ncbi:hypothetical protein CQA38_04790 [Campylobacter sp. MIT 12-5580]|nr:hypothetical protein CQA38_04790 [Campylobacter sp. MIT 12-5580]